MSFLQFSNDLYIGILPSNSSEQLGGFSLEESIELDQVLLTMHAKGTPSGLETLQIEVYGSLNAEIPLFSSVAQNLADIDFDFDPLVNDWVGVVPFVFNRESLSVNDTYYLKIKTTNYTKSASFELGYVFDNPEPVYGRAVEFETSARCLFVGYS